MGLFFWISGRMSAQMLGRWSPSVGPNGKAIALLWLMFLICCVYLELFAAIPFVGHVIPHASPSPLLPTPSEFVQRKMLRLGLPTLMYTLVIHPITFALTLLKWDVDSTVQGLLAYWKSIRGVRGLVWYTALLLVFDCGVALVEGLLRSRRIVLENSQEHRRWDVLMNRALSNWGWVAVAAVSFFIRLWYPVGTVVEPLYVQPAYLPQYIFAYSLGYLSVQEKKDRFTGPFDRAQDTSESTEEGGQPSTQHSLSGALSLHFALTISVLTVLACVIPELWARWSGQLYDSAEPTKGGWNLSALIYAVWNEFSFVLVGPALMAHFQRLYNQPATSWLWQARYSYATYLIHPPLSVAIEVLVDWCLCASGDGLCASDVRWWRIVGPVLFTGVVGLVNAAVSFALGRFLVTYVPGLRKII